jgi:hypothetical protein
LVGEADTSTATTVGEAAGAAPVAGALLVGEADPSTATTAAVLVESIPIVVKADVPVAVIAAIWLVGLLLEMLLLVGLLLIRPLRGPFHLSFDQLLHLGANITSASTGVFSSTVASPTTATTTATVVSSVVVRATLGEVGKLSLKLGVVVVEAPVVPVFIVVATYG